MNDEVKKEEQVDWKKLAEERLDSWKRAAADFENYKKRREKEDGELVAYSKAMVLLKLIPVFDALYAGLAHAPKDEQYKVWSDGMNKTLDSLNWVLVELGIERIKTVGEKFDPHLHEAVETVEGEEPGKIVEEIMPGYTINGSVIRPARVRVGK